jgi:2-formylbenzoate dehydrogenase
VSGRTFAVYSPYTEEKIADVPDGTRADVELAVAAAHEASANWAKTPVIARARLLREVADAIEAHAHDFAVLDSIDGGAPISVMTIDVKIAVETIRYFAGIGLESKGYTVPSSPNLHFTELQPYGVVGRIVPFNHPFLFAASRIAAPLIAGNTVVLKPAETTPLTALMFADLVQEILPPGVVNIVVGDGPEVPDAIVRHPVIRRIAFTGSTTIGRAIQRSAAEVAVKHVSLELGGKNALIAFEDADPAEVARGIVDGMNFTWSGQSCGSTSRLLVHESIADAVLEHVQEALAGRRFVSPLDPTAVQGTMVNRRQYERALSYIDGAIAQGAKVVAGGGAPAGVETGLFIEPTFLDHVEPTFTVAQEEIFGPVVSVLRWTDEAEAIRVANSVEYGLTGSVYTNDIRRAHRVARELEAGFVWINGSSTHFPGLAYGGWKNSGVGSEDSLEEMLSYSRVKAVSVIL